MLATITEANLNLWRQLAVAHPDGPIIDALLDEVERLRAVERSLRNWLQRMILQQDAAKAAL